MTFELLDSVVLVRDLPEHGLKSGDLGAVVEVYPSRRTRDRVRNCFGANPGRGRDQKLRP